MEVIQSKKTTAVRKQRASKIPDSYIYEIMDGKPLYYKGYKNAIKHKKNAESIMGTSSLQSKLLEFFLRLVFKTFSEQYFHVFTGEPGLHLELRNNLSGDLLIFKKKDFPSSKISIKYIDIPAYIYIEIDIRAELEDMTETGYIRNKTQKLLDFGTGKVIWVFTAIQKVLVALPNEDWRWIDWNKDIELGEGENFNIGKFIIDQGIVLEG